MAHGWNIAKAEFERLGETVPLYNWNITINNRLKRVAGRAVYKSMTIELAPWLVDKAPESEVISTVRHEVAHALAGYDAKHGSAWKDACKLVGAKAERCYSREMASLNDSREYRWELYCYRCDEVIGKRRNRPKAGRQYNHRACGGAVSWQSLGSQAIMEGRS